MLSILLLGLSAFIGFSAIGILLILFRRLVLGVKVVDTE